MQSPTRALANERLSGGLDELVGARRSAGVSWRLIAREIHERTGVDVTYETLRIWYAANPPSVAS